MYIDFKKYLANTIYLAAGVLLILQSSFISPHTVWPKYNIINVYVLPISTTNLLNCEMNV